MLLAMSYVFYGWWDYRFLYLIVISTCIDYSTARMIDRGSMTQRERISVAAAAVLSAFFLLTVQWDKITIYNEGLHLVCDVDWAALVPLTWAKWQVLVGTSVAALLACLFHGRIAALPEAFRRKFLVTVSVVANLGILGFFKYFNFFAEGMSDIFQTLFHTAPTPWTLEVILPVGISFYTFQTMSYTIDVYRKEMDSSDSLLDFATYVAFFPQLVAGPIERGKHLLPQFTRSRSASWEDWRSGMWLIGWGLFKKMVVADNMATIVNSVFQPYDTLTTTAVPADGLTCLIAVYAFAFQIYADFSGYSDIARGTARLMGFDLMLNFNLPYFSTSPSAFWQRWHISLSSWLRDYLYVPLGGNRKGPRRTYVNLMLTMLLGGLWHGAAWTFVLWGAYQGALLVVYRFFSAPKELVKAPYWLTLAKGLVMFQFVCIGWLIFRARNVTTIGLFLQSIFLNFGWDAHTIELAQDFLFYGWFLILFQIIQWYTGTLNPMARWHWFVRLNVWIFIILSILLLRNTETIEFIYFAF
tara:strand:+ start:264 stop:1841 length:1578 start_codon:yes stop_codon:yes gene_type:complete